MDLGPRQKGAHMSRFEEVVNEAIDEVVLSEAMKAENLAAHIAERVRDRQEGAARRGLDQGPLPRAQDHARVGRRRPRRSTRCLARRWPRPRHPALIGVEAHGMTACPCAQELVADRSRERLRADGFSDEDIVRILRRRSGGHPQPARHRPPDVGCPEGCAEGIEAQTLLSIVESSMSSEIYELMKRPDEVEVVEHAHMHPRFVEDCVREMIRLAVEEFGDLGEEAFLMARQENLETIHRHSVVAERHGLMGELGRELREQVTVPHHVTRREWLEDRPLWAESPAGGRSFGQVLALFREPPGTAERSDHGRLPGPAATV